MEKKFDVVVVFGEQAARMYWDNADEENPIPEKELEEFGAVVRRSFETEAELNAYLQGVDDCDGWNDYCVAEERFLES